MVDERYAVTEEEKEKTISTYFENGGEGRLTQFPRKEKRKIIVLQHMMSHFKTGKQYTEREVNHILQAIYEDFATIRRYLIEYGFLDRSTDCRFYWVK